ncbi:ras guanine nucleotide exchange factor domain-containing protein [Schizophyllum amplum]|uniref:Ras guanine nucleotide exchange factor domain-containing protein n=1 Tax=Schizophyllum amplum TaxID=97359 RepID=A0A550C672_9AGAR|nr:ras guanine nucleotide exchange factor domain-containing protein [Auriculariopsis ampla]
MLAENHDYARPTDDGSPIIGCYVRGVAAFSPPKDIVDFTEVAIHWTTNKDGNKLPTGASLPGLVDLLVTEFGPETERTRDSILLAFRFFCTPVHLASMFEDRWKNLQKASPESRPAEGLAIIRALLRWLQQYWRDEHDVRAIAVIEHLFQDHIKLCDEIPEDVRDALQQAIQYVLDHPWCKTGGSASGACGTAIPASKFVMPEKPVTDLYTLRLQPKFVREFAQQLVRKSSKLYRAIDGLEWTVYAKIAENKSWSIHGQAVRDFIAYRHRINLWVLKDLLAETTPINRARVIEFWIDVAQTCLSYGDFSTMYSIVWALSQAFIRNVMCVSFLLVGYRRKLCLREMDTYMEVCKREVDGSVRADRMLEAVESKGTPAIPDPGNLTLLTGQIRFKKIVLEGSLKAGRPMVNLKFASHVQVFVKRIQKFQAPYEFAAKPDAVVRFMIEHHLSKFAYEDVTAGGHDRYLQSLHNQCHERTAEPKVFECHGTKITLTSDNVIQYCIAGRMKVLHIDEYDPPDKEIYKSELFRNIDMKI